MFISKPKISFLESKIDRLRCFYSKLIKNSKLHYFLRKRFTANKYSKCEFLICKLTKLQFPIIKSIATTRVAVFKNLLRNSKM